MNSNNWKLRLKYGRENTPFHHYTVLIDGSTTADTTIDCPIGNAWLGIKIWALDYDMAADIACYIAKDIGFNIKDSSHGVQIFETQPEQPPRDKPYGYDIKFTPYMDEQ